MNDAEIEELIEELYPAAREQEAANISKQLVALQKKRAEIEREIQRETNKHKQKPLVTSEADIETMTEAELKILNKKLYMRNYREVNRDKINAKKREYTAKKRTQAQETRAGGHDEQAVQHQLSETRATAPRELPKRKELSKVAAFLAKTSVK